MGITTDIAAADTPDDGPHEPVVLDLVEAGIRADNRPGRTRRDQSGDTHPQPSPTSKPRSAVSASPWLTSGELAERLKVPERTVADWRYKRKGPRFRTFGRRVRYHINDVCSWEDCH